MPLEPPPTDKAFNSREELTDWLKAWAIPQGYDVRIVRSNKRSRAIEYCCVKGGNRYVDRSTGQRAAHTRKTDCQFRVRAKMYSGSETYNLSILNPDHNHDPSWIDAPTRKPRRKPPRPDVTAPGAPLVQSQTASETSLPTSSSKPPVAGAAISAASVIRIGTQPGPASPSRSTRVTPGSGMVSVRMPVIGIPGVPGVPCVPGVRASLTLSESISLITADEARGLLLTYANSHKPLASALTALVEAKHGSVGLRVPDLAGGTMHRTTSRFAPPPTPSAHPMQPSQLPPVQALHTARPLPPPPPPAHAININHDNPPGPMTHDAQNAESAQPGDDSESGESGESGESEESVRA